MQDGRRSLALTPTWSVAVFLTVLIAVSLLVERAIHHLCKWLNRTKRKPLLEATEKMKEVLMLLGFISLMLSATSSSISSICINSKYYNTNFSPCTRSAAEEDREDLAHKNRSHISKLQAFFHGIFTRRSLGGVTTNTCKEGYEPFVSVTGLEQLQRFIFVMAITHVIYSCITILLALLKIYTWRGWEYEAHSNIHTQLTELDSELTKQQRPTFAHSQNASCWSTANILVWLTSFFRQFGKSVTRTDYLTLRLGFVTNHKLAAKYDFHSYMIRCMEEEFKKIVGISAPLWGLVIMFMLLNVAGSNFYFWVSFIPVILLLLVGAKLQHVIATLAIENAGIHGSFEGAVLRPRDELFWYNKPELLLSIIHFILFENAFELASFFWFWWQFGYDSCFLRNHLFVYIRLLLGFSGQFLCSYSTLPLYALVTQMGTHYKAALIPPKVRETIHGWGKAAKRRRKNGAVTDDSIERCSETSSSVSRNKIFNHVGGWKASHSNPQILIDSSKS